jgi:predicted nuclease of predicted toxin-antitoxin system
VRFLIDAQLPPALAVWLEARGHRADHVVDLGLGSADDHAIAAAAAAFGAVLISKDEDFVAGASLGRGKLVWLRCGNVTNAALDAWLAERWPKVESLLGQDETLIELR